MHRCASTITQMILEDGAQTLTEAGTKSYHLLKCWAINGGGYKIQPSLLKCWAINGGGHFYLPKQSRLSASITFYLPRQSRLSASITFSCHLGISPSSLAGPESWHKEAKV
jgi:hypothetical protein